MKRSDALLVAIVLVLLVTLGFLARGELRVWAREEIASVSAEEKLYHARMYTRTGDYQNALRLLQSALQLEPNSPDALRELGFVHFEMQEFEKAVDFLEKACSLRPSDPQLWSVLAKSYLAVGRYADVVAASRKAMELQPNNLLLSYRRIANALEEMGDVEGALAALDEGVHRVPSFGEYYINELKAKMNEWQGDEKRKDDVAQLEWTLSDGISDAELSEYVGELVIGTLEREQVSRLYFDMGFLLGNHRRYAEALTHYDEAIRLDPVFPQAYLNRGLMRLALEDLAGAMTDLKHAEELGMAIPPGLRRELEAGGEG